MNQPVYRPYVPRYMNDFRDAVIASAEAAVIVDDLRAAFLKSDDMQKLRAVLASEVSIRMRIYSSNKYTRFTFPNCPDLLYWVKHILTQYNCELIGDDHWYGHEVEITIPRLGCPDEIIHWVSS